MITTEKRINNVISKKFGIKVKKNNHIIKDFGLDDLDNFELQFGLSNEFGYPITDDEYLTFKTVGDINKFITKKNIQLNKNKKLNSLLKNKI